MLQPHLTTHILYLFFLFSVGCILVRLNPTPRTRMVRGLTQVVNRSVSWVRERVPFLARRRRIWTEVCILAGIVVLRSAAFVILDAARLACRRLAGTG